MQKEHLYFLGAAAVAFLYLNSQGMVPASTTPVLSYPFNLGFNLANGSFSFSAAGTAS